MLAYEIPDLSTLPVNPYQAAECQGYDSSRALRDLPPGQRRAAGERASDAMVATSAAAVSDVVSMVEQHRPNLLSLFLL